MAKFILCCLLVMSCCFILPSIAGPVVISSVVIAGGSMGTCPSLNASKAVLKENISNILQQLNDCSCNGSGEWTRIAYVNMSDSRQQCPANWTTITTPIRGCGRPTRYCHSAIFPSHGRSYSRVCGKVLAYQRGSTEAFNTPFNTLEGPYLDGISLTHGPAGSRQHIWSFAVARNLIERVSSNCPCTSSRSEGLFPSIGTDYFCDSGNPAAAGYRSGHYYTDKLLWDGTGCIVPNTCCKFNHPPWFCKALPQPTTDDLEVRNCCSDYPRNEDALVRLIDIYIS